MNSLDSLWFLFRDPDDFAHRSSRLQWQPRVGALTLAQNQTLWLPATDPDEALLAWQQARPLALDRHGQVARLAADGSRIECWAASAWRPVRDQDLQPLLAPAGRFVDLALGGDERLAAAYSDGADQHGVLVFHLGRRWQTACPLPVAVLRCVVDADCRIWCVTADRLLLLEGEPLPAPYRPIAQRFEPVSVNPHPLRTVAEQHLPSGWQGLALCAHQRTVFVLCHDGAGSQTVLAYARRQALRDTPRRLEIGMGVPFSVDIGVLADKRLALLAPQRAEAGEFVQRDCAVLALQDEQAVLLRERHPMASLAGLRFVSSADSLLRYAAEPLTADTDLPPVPRLLAPLARPQYRLEATALLNRVLDSGRPGTSWHRLYLDARIPPGCAVRVAARVFDDSAARGSAALLAQPAPLWNPLPSELPFTESLAGHQAGQAGLFEILLQRPDGPVRRLSGRYLQLQITLQGNGRSTPAVFAMRVHAPRPDWQDTWLPSLFRQETPERAGASGPANGADLRERLLAAMEGMLTPIEARIACAEQWLQPTAMPSPVLASLASSLGVHLPAHWPLPRQREQLRLGTLLQQWHGTLAGLNLALDIACDGGVSRGEVVAVENFRLRRTMATLLGVDMDDQDHPLTLGTGMSGNSRIGPSLILSESDAREFLALFSAQQALGDEREQVQAFFESHANQLTVLLHGAGTGRRNEVEAVLQREVPAHVQWRIFETEHSFVLGMSPLLAVDTFVEPQPDARRVVLGDTLLGREGLLENPAAFSPTHINAAGTGA